MCKEYPKETSNWAGVENEWTTWTNTVAPQNDNAADYCKDHPLEIPFWHELFSGSPINTKEFINPHIPTARDCPEFETCNSLIWHNRGNKRKLYIIYKYMYI